jgi:MOSC domain-containing protein YiiM
MQGRVVAVCISEKKGTQKINVNEAEFVIDHGIKGDAHAGKTHRQVSFLSLDKVDDFRSKGAEVQDGAFGENLVVSGIDFKALPKGTRLKSGDVEFEITQIGKECHTRCAIYHKMGDCIMPREGVFGVVLSAGTIKTGDTLEVIQVAENV